MFPAQTSFIPITVAVARWVEVNGFGGNYPYWYLGTTPIKYLMGPVVPGILVLLRKILPNFSFFDLSLLLIIVSYLVAAFGWGFLALKLSGNKKVGQVVFALSLVLPFTIFYSMAFGEVSSVVASSLTPWMLAAYASIQNSPLRQDFGGRAKFKIQNLCFPTLSLTFLLLVNSTAAVSAVVGLVILGVVGSKHWEEGLKQVGMVIFLGWFLSLFWYGPGYWLTIWGAPAFGGRAAAFSLIWVFNLFREFAPFFLAFVVTFWKIKKYSPYEKFALSWFLGFGFLTLVRFIANPAFWLDWTTWISEVEIGVVFLLSIFLKRFPSRKLSIIYLLFTIYFMGSWLWVWQKRDLWLPRRDISQSVDYKVASELKHRVRPGETVFLSGTTAFWLNSLVDVRQVRGGRDEVASGDKWRKVAWEVRQGTDGQRSADLLKELGVGYLVVHTNKSDEFYHDFSNVEKFERAGSLKKVYEVNGDIIYEVVLAK